MARVSAEYGMTYWEVGQLPLRTFWSFNRQIDRLRAERDQRQFRLMGASQSPESANELLEALRVELDCPVVVTKAFDEAKFEELANRMNNGA